jgi:hypothetical protein
MVLAPQGAAALGSDARQVLLKLGQELVDPLDVEAWFPSSSSTVARG